MAVGKRARDIVITKTNGRCGYCGMPPYKNHPLIPEHMTPQSRGGSNDVDNLVPACVSCNVRKSNRNVDEFRDYITSSLTAKFMELASSLYEYQGYISNEDISDMVRDLQAIESRVSNIEVRFFMERVHDPNSWRAVYDEY